MENLFDLDVQVKQTTTNESQKELALLDSLFCTAYSGCCSWI